ncbi:hypothetical protein EC991_003061 [Linnemannia zychae]|nr:hypothetical protein EC991_003061 [Linnemannia zychae]
MALFSDLPIEIIALIANHFTTCDIKILTLVSRFCNLNFAHYLWQHAKVDNFHSDRQLLPVLNKYADSILSLCLNGQVHEDYYCSITFPRLIAFQQNYTERDDVNPEAMGPMLSIFLQRHPAIQDVAIIARPGLHVIENFWDTVFFSLNNPRRLKIDGIRDMVVNCGVGGSKFQRACSRFKEIDYSGVDQPEIELQDKNLLKGPSGLGEWARKCRNLTRLHWKGPMSITELAFVAEQRVWPFLDDLSLGDVAVPDEKLAGLIGHLPPLKHLKLAAWKFGPTCYNALRDRHLDSLRTLSLTGSNRESSRINVDILLHFVNLDEFEASFICLRDSWFNPFRWVCEGLRCLRVNFESDPYRDSATSLFFRRLSELKQLEELDINRYSRTVCTYRTQCYGQWPQFTLDGWHLEQLSTLKQLKIFRFKGSAQNLSVKDVEWMLENWPLIEELGPCHFSDTEALVLRFEGVVSKEFYCITFPALVNFQHTFHTFPGRDSDSKYVDSCVPDFFTRNRTIRDLTLTTHGASLNQRFWEAIHTSIASPRRLRIDGPQLGMQILLGVGPAFWQACSRFEEVVYRGKDQAGSAAFGDIDFSRLKRLDYMTTEYPRHAETFWRRICSCHNLTKLRWGGTIPLRQVASAAKHPVWPFLEDLQLGVVHGSDQDLADVIFHHLPPLKQLSLSSGAFGPLCFGILRERHFATLTSLDAPKSNLFSSRMALDVLLHCVNLEQLRVYHIYMRDVRATPQPWVCRGLKHLEVTFESDPNDYEADALLFEQLSKLTHLKHINIIQGNQFTFFGSIVEPSPQWRLDSGLALLSTMTQLEELTFGEGEQDLREEDVVWMLDHWPALKMLRGDLSLRPDVHKKLRALVRRRGVGT